MDLPQVVQPQAECYSEIAVEVRKTILRITGAPDVATRLAVVIAMIAYSARTRN